MDEFSEILAGIEFLRSGLQEKLPGDWKMVNHIVHERVPGIGDIQRVQLTAESSRHNTVLEGSADWIMRTALQMDARVEAAKLARPTDGH